MSEIKIQRFNIDVDDNWKVTIQEEKEGANPIGNERQMVPHPDGADGMIPGTPTVEIPPDQGDLTLLCQGDQAAFWKTFRAVTIQRTPPGVTFGQYLFECLLGKANWKVLLAACDPESTIEIALNWNKSNKYLHRLNWELMYDGEHFLVAQPQRRVAITRRIKNIETQLDEDSMKLNLPPKILFVTGVPLHDQEIRPAAEYLGLLDEFQDKQRSVNSYLLEDAKHSDLKQALVDFKPDVVYFVCHGYFDEKGSYLRLKNDLGIEQHFYADELGQILQEKGLRPKLVVLSACYSATMPHYRVIPEAFESDQEKAKPQPGEILGPGLAGPMAAELIEHGVPVVVGMAGRVSDTACRLFTRRFAESLIQGEPLVYSTAQGRKAAHVEGDYWKDSIDWGFPTLYMASNVPHNYAPVDPLEKDPACTIQARIEGYAIPKYPRFFGRTEIIKLYYALFKADGPKIILARTPKDAEGYGKTRLIQELTRRALLDGNIPLSIIIDRKGKDTPKTPLQLALAILRQIYHARDVLKSGIPPLPDSQLLNMLMIVLPEPNKTKFENYKTGNFRLYKNELLNHLSKLEKEQEPDISPDSIKEALIEDIKALVKDAAADPITKGGGGFPVVFLDHVHDYDAAREALLGSESTSRWLGNFGMGDDQFPIPVVMTYENSQEFKSFLENTNLTRHRLVDIKPFNENNGEDLLAYSRFLLYPDVNYSIPGLKEPLVANPDPVKKPWADTFHEIFKVHIGGIPKKMRDPKNGQPNFVVARNREVFIPANDADFIERNKKDL